MIARVARIVKRGLMRLAVIGVTVLAVSMRAGIGPSWR
jgi:hypothetical protein